ncbi:SAM-dependent methyltransferase TehB [Lonsdalea quercina]|uniref:SAM-dependent methyltransferase TehB n=1 Tax=Lonsdalea quercina TaxID=71657 RepID=UPI00397576FA
MNALMCYRQLPVWDCGTLQTALREEINAQDATWTKLAVLKGELTLTMLSEHDEALSTHRLSPQYSSPYIQPQQRYRIETCSDDMLCQLSLYCHPDDYFHQKYGLTRTHSEVVDALRNLGSGKALDLGCGRGRNALYLHQKGWNVTAWDKSPESIHALNSIIEQEHLEGIRAREHDINLADIDDAYDMILSTVVLMFLERSRIPAIIQNMQHQTVDGGYNLIVAAMSTEDSPCPLPFSFTFKEDELRRYYQGWEIVKYNQDVGELHKTDTYGKRIKLRFVTLLARKPR